MLTVLKETSSTDASVSGKPRGRDRRVAPRTLVDARGELYLCPGSSRTAPLNVVIRDVSATGVGVVHSDPLPMGQKYVVKEPTISRGKHVLYTVVRSEPLVAGGYAIGLHASHLMDNNGGFLHSANGSLPRTSGMAKLLTLALLLGCLAAVCLLH
jgi:hypothetical protein